MKLKLNLSPDANIFAQVIRMVREVEGHPYTPITEDMFRTSGRRSIEAILSELDPSNETGTKKNRKLLTKDKYSPMTGFCLAFGQEGDVLIDVTVLEVRTMTDPIVRPNLTNTFETLNSSFEARLAAGAVGKGHHLSLIHI